jgi:methionine-rich copper-binding protein CopC
MNARLAIRPRRGGFTLLVFVAALALALPPGVAAHSELKTADPPDGAVLSTPPPEVVLTFTEALDPAKSSVTLHDAGGTEIAKGSVDPTDNTVMRLTPPPLDPGTYEIRWTSVSLDGHLLRDTLHFTLTAPTPSPTPAPTATSSASPSPTAAPTPSPSPSPSASPGPGRDNTSADDVLLPILAALVVVGVLGAMLLRGRSRGGGSA